MDLEQAIEAVTKLEIQNEQLTTDLNKDWTEFAMKEEGLWTIQS